MLTEFDFGLKVADMSANSILKKVRQTWHNFIDYLYSPGFINGVFFIFGLVLAGLVRWSVLDYQSMDYKNFLSPWYDYITRNGGFESLQDNFQNYTPPYIYMLTASTYLDLPKIVAIKLISIIFDFILAFVGYKIVAFLCQSKLSELQNTGNLSNLPAQHLPVVAFFTILFAPTLIFNGAVWAQCDVIYTTFLFAALYSVLKKRFFWVFVFFAVAVSFKLQSVFYLPILAVLLLKKRLNPLYLLVLPAIYVLLILPDAMIGDFETEFMESVQVYSDQSNTYNSLSMGAPSFYVWLAGASYELFRSFGMFLGASVGVGLTYLFWRKSDSDKPRFWLNLALLSSLALPFFLPKMHERYFFVADLTSIIYAFYFGRRFWVPVVINLVSFFAYGPFLLGFRGFETSDLSLVNLILIVYLVAKICSENWSQPAPNNSSFSPHTTPPRPIPKLIS